MTRTRWLLTIVSFAATIRRSESVPRGESRTLDLVHGAARVPATLLLPATAGPAPAALLLHGFSSNKERMAQSVGRELQRHGVASLALDLPFHGERDGGAELPVRNPLALVSSWRTAVREARAATEWLAAQREVEADRVAIVGYSLGGFLALMTAAEEPLLRAVALAAAGDLPDTTPYAALVRRAVDPLRAVRRLGGRPLLLVNGRRDTTTRPAQAERLFAYAEEPKTLRWYDGGHWPPPSAIEGAAEWVALELEKVPRTARASRG
jgi:dienelactone hydrolase